MNLVGQGLRGEWKGCGVGEEAASVLPGWARVHSTLLAGWKWVPAGEGPA